MICPKDSQPCIDDLCYGGSCLRMPGCSPLVKCPGGCGALVSRDGDDVDECECEPEFIEWEDDA
jgi:hypothetical protein